MPSSSLPRGAAPSRAATASPEGSPTPLPRSRSRTASEWRSPSLNSPVISRSDHPDVQLLAQEMWNAHMGPAFANGSIDVALSLCPEIAAELEVETIRSERVVALLPDRHPLSGEDAISLSALAGEEFVLFPREIAPRLHDAFIAIY